MDSPDRILGRLEEFQRSAERRFDAIEQKVDALNQFKWRVAGGAALLSFLLASGAQVLVKLFSVSASANQGQVNKGE